MAGTTLSGIRHFAAAGALATMTLHASATSAAPLNLSDVPLFVSESVPPLALLVMGRDHKLYYEAYDDASDLNGDGIIDVDYRPDAIDYFGYFDSFKCYSYSSGRFQPTTTSGNKRCTSGWSGDFLNYVTTSRMDAMRKVLYGGYRRTEASGRTELERTHIPQDAHSWGKEYTSVGVNGYDIRDYTPLGLPSEGTRHLFANTSLGYDDPPLMRVLNDSRYRIWEWVSIERPVAGDRCVDGGSGPLCEEEAATDQYRIVPSTFFDTLERSFYDIPPGYDNGDFDDAGEFQDVIDDLGEPLEQSSIGNIDGSETPAGQPDYFVTVFRGTFSTDGARILDFGIDGDDAIELRVNGNVVVGWYGPHGAAGNGSSHTGTVAVEAGTHTIEFRHVEFAGDQSYRLYRRTSQPASRMTDYNVRVDVCVPGLLEDNCGRYVDGSDTQTYRPTGLLHDFGENNRMLFGLLTGSYAKNLSGGVLRRNVGSFSSEIDPETGNFHSGDAGIVNTIDRLRTAGFNYSSYQYGCGWITDRPIREGECEMWGNPVGEMMYEGLRYFAGKGSPTSEYMIAGSGNTDADLGLPLADWDNPYAPGSAARDAGADYCSKPFQLVISDINPSYDTTLAPGSAFGGFSGDVGGLSVNQQLNAISVAEDAFPGTFYIGEAGGDYTGTPSPKTVNSLATARGLSPEEPTKQGGYTAAAIAYYGHQNEVTNAPDQPAGQRMQTFAVALASPLPRIDIPAGNGNVTLVPFAKSVGATGGFTISGDEGDFQPTNQIVDFYVDTIRNVEGFPADASVNDGRAFYRFRINFEDVEQGADHDMDAIVLYEVRVNADGSITVDLDSTYAAGSIIHHLGYVISGTTRDGTYLEVRDRDTSAGNDPDYFMDTPPGVWADDSGDGWNNGEALPLSTSRTFTPGGGDGADFLRDPLWYAAKWGGFRDQNNNGVPDEGEWDRTGDGSPDNYFLVTNAGDLQAQLTAAFEEILARTSSATAASFSSGTLQAETKLFQVRFNSEGWTGELLAYDLLDDDVIDGDGNIEAFAGSIDGLAWNAADNLQPGDWNTGRRIVTWRPDEDGSGGTGRPFRWPSLSAPVSSFTSLADLEAALPESSTLSASQVLALSRTPGTEQVDERGEERLQYVRGRDIDDFRERESILGDIVHSSPAFIGQSQFRYRDDWGSGAPENAQPYSEFRSDTADRREMVYVGANDGMLHAFDAQTGEEVYAFVPDATYRNLTELTDPDYSHRYFVDGTPNHADAFFGGEWHSLLLGGLRKGGRSLYALDVTEPPGDIDTETQVADKVLWEFTDPNLGYTYAQPTAGRLATGSWYVFAGNGYNSTSASGNAGLLVIEAGSGTRTRFIDTGEGASDDPLGLNRPNGLASAIPVDVNGDLVVDYVYGGDLFGNLWRFDVRSTTTGQWDAELVYTATDDDGNPQPITVQPTVGTHPAGRPGVMVYFGTGKYIEVGDKSVDNQPDQSIYGIWDNPELNNQSISRDDLQPQEILAQQTGDFEGRTRDVRVTSNESVDWDDGRKGWRLDLKFGSDNAGERLISRPLLRGGRLIFNTFIPSANPCDFGGSSWLMALSSRDGSRLNQTPFDLSGDGVFDIDDYFDSDGSGDLPEGLIVTSGTRNTSLGTVPALLFDPNRNRELAITPSEDGAAPGEGEDDGSQTGLNPGLNEAGRQSWREIR